MRHRFFVEDDLIKIGWGNEGTLAEWDAIIGWALKRLDNSEFVFHVLLDFSDAESVTEDMFQPELAGELADHPQAGWLLLVSHNPIFVHFVNTHWITQADQDIGVRAFMRVSDALGWLHNKPL